VELPSSILNYPVSMSLFCLSHNLFIYCTSGLALDIIKINKQGCGLARKEHRNAVNVFAQLQINQWLIARVSCALGTRAAPAQNECGGRKQNEKN